MVEMSALNHLMATHILQQAQQVEQLYDQVSRYLVCVALLDEFCGTASSTVFVPMCSLELLVYV